MPKLIAMDDKVKEAVELLQYVVLIKRSKFQENHPSRLVSEEVLSMWYQEDG